MNRRPCASARAAAAPRAALASLLLTPIFFLGSVACFSGAEEPTSASRPVTIVTAAFDQRIVVHSSVLRFELLGTEGRSATGAVVRFEGELEEGRALDEAYFATVERAGGAAEGAGERPGERAGEWAGERAGEQSNLVVEVRVADGLWQVVAPDPRRTFTGRLRVELEDEVGVFARATIDELDLTFVDGMAPAVEPIASGSYHVGQTLKVDGAGFLRPEEGSTWLVVEDGTLRYPGGTTRRITNARVALQWSGRRDEASLPVSPVLFGVREGRFEGKLRFVNELTTGERFEGVQPSSFACDLTGPRIDAFDPPEGSRGQVVRVRGRGLLPDDAAAGTGMYLLFEGVLTPAAGGEAIDFRGARVAAQVPVRVRDHRSLDLQVWYDVDEGSRRLRGLGAVPGTFRGSVTPVTFDASAEQVGPASELEFQVLPTKQVVYLKYLPGFGTTLQRLGLRHVEPEIRDRVVFVLARDYAEVNVSFVESPPRDFVEYTTLEIGGVDPSGMLQFGYDNSFNEGGKDTGNLFLSDYLGGVNRHSEQAGFLAYGGVFVDSFRGFSPRLFPDNLGTSAGFDLRMASFMEELGGTPVGAPEWPDGPRQEAIREALHLIGTLTGHTASHEIGHALGLSYFPESVEDHAERFHNEAPGPGLIMDAGGERPFEERAEIDGAEPPRFNSQNLDYLRSILPRPAP